ncbi:hypothetical protein F5Y04DRAFT_276001 [Hypomontagnella monticulosa]|nr:hypothetical protein F5Y04DRAFT_276001 [Hypomontagnella monticulosa]
MSFQISIGDVVLLTQIAWRLARTFTKGRNSAPSEFCDVENQLYSLSAALEAIGNDLKKGEVDTGNASPISTGEDGESHGQNKIDHILQNCRRTLGHLENIVKKYSVILHPNTSSAWDTYVVRNWKKIEWTTEKGDLNALRSQIMIHTNSLNLLLGIAISSQTANIKKSVDTSSDMIKELYEWYKDNLKGNRSPEDDNQVLNPDTAAGYLATATASLDHTFQLVVRTDQGSRLICPQTHFNREPDPRHSAAGGNLEAGQLFTCACPNHGGSGLHQSAVQRYMLSRLTFPARVVGEERTWILYRVADRHANQFVTIYITKIHPGYIQILEEAILQDLAIRQADSILDGGPGNILSYISADTEEERILASIGELVIAQKSVESITFKHEGVTYTRKYVKDVQVLQYQTVALNHPRARTQTGPLQPLDYAEVLVTYDEHEQEEGDVDSTVLHLKRHTSIGLDGDGASLRIDSIQTMGSSGDRPAVSLDNVDVTIQFTSREAARELHRKLEDMRMELYIRDLRYPRSNETVSLHLQVARIECDNIYISDADMTVATDTEGKHRLIIESRNKCTLISQVLVDDFFKSPRGKPDYSGPTYVVQFGEDGTRSLYKYDHGFRYVNLSGAQADRMLKLAWSSMSMNLEQGSDSAGVAGTS